jgi:hypothetical protein
MIHAHNSILIQDSLDGTVFEPFNLTFLFQEFVQFLANNRANLAKLKKLDLCFTPNPPKGMTSKTYLSFVRHSKVKEIKNFGPFIYDFQDMVMIYLMVLSC